MDGSGSGNKPPKDEEVITKDMDKTFDPDKYNLVFCLSCKGGTFYEWR